MSTNNNNHGAWITRKERKRRLPAPTEEGSDEGVGLGGGGVMKMTGTDKNSSVSIEVDKSATNSSKPRASLHSFPLSCPSSKIPASLAPHLGWTKLSSSASCRRRRIRQRQQDLLRTRRLMALSDLDEEEGVVYKKVDGRAIFFIHDPLFDNSDENDEMVDGGEAEEEDSRRGGSKRIWFQGRFFPSVVSDGEGESRTDDYNSMESWGILAETGANYVDDCLLCPDGGYRILDMTFLRQSANMQGVSTEGGRKDNQQPLPQFQFRQRWTARNLIWTGGNMMAITTEEHSLSLPTSLMLNQKKKQNLNTTPSVSFEPSKLVEGNLAIELASKYFPQLVRRLQVRDIIEDGDDIGGRSLDDAMVLIGDMQVSAPESFVAVLPGGQR